MNHPQRADTRHSFDAAQHQIDREAISGAALEVVDKLVEAGYSAELVGGCVRDLVLGRRPKDFDVATEAEPEQVRDIFRRSRLVGRRFRLAHVRIGREIVEVSTYRRSPDESGGDYVIHNEHGRILRDNLYGRQDDDAHRRDFTINALYYDPRHDTVVDYVDGFEDLRHRVVRTIGDPEKRFTEDPVRMLRAVRFAAKLEFDLDEECLSQLILLAHNLGHVPPARLFDEALKLFQHGQAEVTYDLLEEYGLLEELFPVGIATGARDSERQHLRLVRLALQNTDKRVAIGKPVIAAFLFAVLLWYPVVGEKKRLIRKGLPSPQAQIRAANKVVAEQSMRIALPRRVVTVIHEIWAMQYPLESRRPKKIYQLLENRRFRAAYDFLLLRAETGEVDPKIAEWWTEIQEVGEERKSAMVSSLKSPSREKGRRRPRRRAKTDQKVG